MEASDTRRIRLAVAGAGLIAQVIHLPTLDRLRDHFEVVALADPSVRVRDRVAARHGIPATQADHRSLLELDVDAVLVCAPNGLHAEIVLDALDAGCHVLVEKPLCLTVRDAERIVERRDETGLVVQVGYMKRFDPAYEALSAWAERRDREEQVITTLTVDPGLGRLYAPAGFIRSDDVPERTLERLSRSTASQVGAAVGVDSPEEVRIFSEAFLGALVHDVNAVLGVMRPSAVQVLDAWASDDASLVGGHIRLPGEVRCTMSWVLARGAERFEQRLRFAGAHGSRTLTFPPPYLRPASARLTVDEDGGTGEAAPSGASTVDAYTRELEHFHDCVTSRTTCRTPPEQARADIELLTRLFEVHLAGRVAA